ATIVMPEGTPLNKVQSTKAFLEGAVNGGRIVLFGATYDDAFEEARRIQQAESRTFVHPFDDDHVMAGQGTIGLELTEQTQYVDDIVLVDEEGIAEAILTLLEKEKTVAEGAGAASLAALLQSRLPVAGKKVAFLVSGGNIDVNVISRIIERGLVKSGRVVRL